MSVNCKKRVCNIISYLADFFKATSYSYFTGKPKLQLSSDAPSDLLSPSLEKEHAITVGKRAR